MISQLKLHIWIDLKQYFSWVWSFRLSLVTVWEDTKRWAACHWRFWCFSGYLRFLIINFCHNWYDCSIAHNNFCAIASKWTFYIILIWIILWVKLWFITFILFLYYIDCTLTSVFHGLCNLLSMSFDQRLNEQWCCLTYWEYQVAC